MTTILSGIEKLDAITGGFHPGELVLICGRPGVGKSTLLEQILINTAQTAVRNKRPEFALYFSLELSHLPNIPRFRGIRNLQAEAVIVDTFPGVSARYITDKYALLKNTHRISMVAIDCLQLMKIDTKEFALYTEGEITAIVSRLKELAVKEQICILITSQLPLHVDMRPGAASKLSDLSCYSEIEPLADLVILLHRPHLDVNRPEFLPGPTTVTVTKNRQGNIGTCELPGDVCSKSDMFSWRWHKDKTKLHYATIRYHLRWLFFGSPNPDDGPRPDNYEHNGYVINGFRMDDDGFSRLNATLRWPIAADDPILDHDISEKFVEILSLPKPEQYNAFCPLDGYVTAINAECHWRLPQGEHVSDDGPDSVYRLCPHCLMELASKMEIRRCIRSID